MHLSVSTSAVLFNIYILLKFLNWLKRDAFHARINSFFALMYFIISGDFPGSVLNFIADLFRTNVLADNKQFCDAYMAINYFWFLKVLGILSVTLLFTVECFAPMLYTFLNYIGWALVVLSVMYWTLVKYWIGTFGAKPGMLVNGIYRYCGLANKEADKCFYDFQSLVHLFSLVMAFVFYRESKKEKYNETKKTFYMAVSKYLFLLGLVDTLSILRWTLKNIFKISLSLEVDEFIFDYERMVPGIMGVLHMSESIMGPILDFIVGGQHA
eukprot:GAHX01003436.1.p1 GENE.GAHX01003436.1~~GAHX01003436.1.p1  ORF type:complete len:269 (+),score=27.20 GAHX01003436.1:207-1013(+)